MKSPCYHAYIWSKNVNSVNTTLYYEPKKSVGCPFFPISHEKIIALMPYAHILWKNVHSLKNTLLSSLYFVKKTSILSKTLCSYVIFSKFSWKIPLLSRPYLVKKRQFTRVVRLPNFGKWTLVNEHQNYFINLT